MIYFALAHKYTDRGHLRVDSKLAEELKPNDWVEADTELGRRAFQLIKKVKETSDQPLIGQVVRKMTEEKLDQIRSWAEKEADTLQIFKDRVKKYDLEMKPIEALMTVDQDRIIFFFTAPDRVDFRRLVKDLAATFHKLIRLQQINQRNATMIKGGVGPCGRPICCRSLPQVCPREIRSEIVVEQGLQGVDSSKLSGSCGKLVCCLKYEQRQYQEILEKLPKLGDRIKVKEEGFGEVVDINPLKGTVLVKLGEDKTKEVRI